MEADPNPFPKIHLIDIGRFIGRLIPRLPLTSEIPVRGGEAMLDTQLYDQLGETSDGV